MEVFPSIEITMSVSEATPRVVAFIPARGGSKRIPRKNLRRLGGKPLLRYAVDSAIESGVFSEVVVSSDDPEVSDLVAQWPDVVFHERDPALADDFSRVPEVAQAWLANLDEPARPDTIGVLLPPCPFRTGVHVREAYEKFRETDPDGFLVSVTAYDFPPQFALRWSEESSTRLEMVDPDVYGKTTRSQSVERLWHPNGAMYFCNAAAFLETGSFFSDPLSGYEMSPQDSLDLDWPHQFEQAEIELKIRNAKKP